MFRLYRWIFKQSLAKLASSVIITTGFRVVCTPWNISQLLLTAGFTQPVEYYKTYQDLACFQAILSHVCGVLLKRLTVWI